MMADTDKKAKNKLQLLHRSELGKASNYTVPEQLTTGYDRCEMIIMECVK